VRPGVRCARMRRSLVLACAAAALTGAAAGEASAQEARARLEYARAADDGCPDEATLRDAVSARLGYVPFDEAAPRTVRVRIARAARRIEVTIDVIEDGAITGTRDLGARARAGTCPISEALVLAVSLAIDPMTLAAGPLAPPPALEPEPEPTTCPEPEPCAACPRCPEVVPATDARPAEVTARLSAAAVLGLAPLPLPTGGLRLAVGARLLDFSIDVELRGDVPTTGGDADGRTATATATWVSGTLALCGHLEVLALCGLSTMGALVAWGGGVDRPETRVMGFATAGARIGLEIPVDPALAITVSADAGYVLTPAALVVDGRTLHTTPPAVGSAGVGVLVRIL
jgi:hypothetical protein